MDALADKENIECSFELCKEVVQADRDFKASIKRAFGEETRKYEISKEELEIEELLNVVLKEKIIDDYLEKTKELIGTTKEGSEAVLPFKSEISEYKTEKEKANKATKLLKIDNENKKRREKIKADTAFSKDRNKLLEEWENKYKNNMEESLSKLEDFLNKNNAQEELLLQVNEGYKKLRNFSFLIENKDSFSALFKDSPMLFQALEEIRSDKNFAASFREACKMQEIDESSVDKAIIKYTRILNLSNMKSTITNVELDENKLITKWGLSDTIKLIMLDEGGYLPLFKEHNDEMIGSLARYEVMVEKCVNTDNSDIN